MNEPIKTENKEENNKRMYASGVSNAKRKKARLKRKKENKSMKENNLQDCKPIKGILISSSCLGFYDNKRNDISLISLETDATVCGYFTQNMYRSATVVISENNIKEIHQIYNCQCWQCKCLYWL